MDKERMIWIFRWLDWDQLTDWEERFVTSVEEYFRKHGRLSEKQEHILEDLFRRKSK